MEKHFIRVIALIMAAFALIPSVDVYAGSRRKAPATGKVVKSEQENDALLLECFPCKTATLYINSQLFA